VVCFAGDIEDHEIPEVCFSEGVPDFLKSSPDLGIRDVTPDSEDDGDSSWSQVFICGLC
jgi:hypothetical protein